MVPFELPPNSTQLPLFNEGKMSYVCDPPFVAAYRACKELEEAGEQTDSPTQVVRARMLGYLLINIPSVGAQDKFVKAINETPNVDTLNRLGDTIIRFFVLNFRTSQQSSSIASEDTDSDNDADNLVTSMPSPSETKQKALRRDRNRCILTGRFDLSAPTYPEDVLFRPVETMCAFIIPKATIGSLDPSLDATSASDYPQIVKEIMRTFIQDATGTEAMDVNSLHNIMTLQYDPYHLFNSLDLWFEQTSEANVYHIETILTTTTTLPLLSPTLLALHAACAKVAHLSGAAQLVDFLLCEGFEIIDEIELEVNEELTDD
ncbi:hypothetical protein ONZ45_g14179 [Pleurotus djamor]|nr:hypothetical protein ONZ45_g14179 [Pleurotus djamor]